jgi:rhodanese-related sulfurtransferase
MAVKRISPEEARDLMDKEGYAYLDVRSVPEFAAGHPTGSYNVPLLDMGPAGMTPNPDFLAVVAKAAALLEQAGFTNIVAQRNGYEGTPLPTGGVEPGWRPKGLPTSTESAPDRTYDGLKTRR